MPLVKIQTAALGNPREVHAEPDGSLKIPPYHLHDCYDWRFSDTSIDELARIPPDSWLGQYAHATYNVPAEAVQHWFSSHQVRQFHRAAKLSDNENEPQSSIDPDPTRSRL